MVWVRRIDATASACGAVSAPSFTVTVANATRPSFDTGLIAASTTLAADRRRSTSFIMSASSRSNSATSRGSASATAASRFGSACARGLSTDSGSSANFCRPPRIPARSSASAFVTPGITPASQFPARTSPSSTGAGSRAMLAAVGRARARDPKRSGATSASGASTFAASCTSARLRPVSLTSTLLIPAVTASGSEVFKTSGHLRPKFFSKGVWTQATWGSLAKASSIGMTFSRTASSVALPFLGLHTTVNDDVGSAAGVPIFWSKSCACCDGVPGSAKESTVVPPNKRPAPRAMSSTSNQARIADFGWRIAQALMRECYGSSVVL